MNKLYYLLVTLLILCSQMRIVVAQVQDPTPSFSVTATNVNSTIDGALNESEWAQHREVDQFRQYLSSDTAVVLFPFPNSAISFSKTPIYLGFSVARKCLIPRWVTRISRPSIRAASASNLTRSPERIRPFASCQVSDSMVR